MARLPFEGDYPLTQPFGVNADRYVRFGLAGHNGRDYGTPPLTPLLAPADAVIWERGYDAAGYGFYVKMRTPAGEDWLLAHLTHQCGRPEGEWVAEGAYVACSGTTGNSTGPHVHVGYRRDGTDHRGMYQGWSDPPLP